MEKQRVTRRSFNPLKVYCLPEERLKIEENAKASGKSVSSFLVAVGQGYQVSGIVDFEQVREMARINGDLGRLGGLLKLWLTDDEKTAHFGETTLRAVLAKIETTQNQLSETMAKVVMPRTDPKF